MFARRTQGAANIRTLMEELETLELLVGPHHVICEKSMSERISSDMTRLMFHI